MKIGKHKNNHADSNQSRDYAKLYIPVSLRKNNEQIGENSFQNIVLVHNFKNYHQ